MNISKIKHQFSKAEKEYKFWQDTVECYNKYVNQPFPQSHIDTIFIAYLLNDSATTTAVKLDRLDIKTQTGNKISATYITQIIDNNKAGDKQLTTVVKRLLKISREKAKPFLAK